MSFSKEWDEMYKKGTNNSIWPWSEVVTMFYHYFKNNNGGLKVLELGCGAGANIPFFKAIGVDYYGVDGSETKIEQLKSIYGSDKQIHLEACDFSSSIPFNESFDLVLDRSSVTHNNSCGIRNAVDLAYSKLNEGGYYFGIDWFSINHDSYTDESLDFEVIDDKTKSFESGCFSGLGNVHFTDEEDIKAIFSKFVICELYEKVETWRLPDRKCLARWCFVAKKK